MKLIHKTNKDRSRKNHLFQLESLENRELLTSGVWVGQTGVDLVGPWTQQKPSTIQDIEVQLSGIPESKIILKAVVQGYGADRWDFGGPDGSWLADLQRTQGSSLASLYFEPARVETGREFSVGLTYTDGSFEEIYFQGGTADPALKAPGMGLTAQWLGASAKVDMTTPSATLGPDGITDFQIAVSQINTNKSVQAVDIVDAKNVWVASYGLNPSRVGTLELTRQSSSSDQAILTFSKPSQTLTGPLTVQLTYSDGTKETATCELGSTATETVNIGPIPTITASLASVQWVGQQVADTNRPGWVQIKLSNLPESGISAFQVNDLKGQSWLWTISGQGSPWPTVYGQKSMVAYRDTQGDWIIEFDSRLDLNKSPLTILALSDMGRTYQVDFQGGSVDLSKRALLPSNSSITAQPGDDLQALVNQYGTVNLSSGVFVMNSPLVLKNPVNLVGTSASVIEFRQPISSPGWSTVVTIGSGNVRLSGFQIQFAGSVKWLDNIRYGPAVIGSVDNFSTEISHVGPISNVLIENLNITGPQPTSFLQEAPRLVRMIDDVSGVIRDNNFFGGWVEVTGGPWSITGNTNNGVWPDSFAYDAFAAHGLQGLDLANNTVDRTGNSGVIFRLIVVNGQSSAINISDNQALGLGSSLSDPWQMQQTNANEVILTEAYNVSFEGELLAVDASRRIVQVGATLGQAYQPGDLFAVLDGPNAGTWAVVVAVINQNTIVLDKALPEWVQKGTAVSINKGIHDIRISGNLIEQTDRPQSLASVLVGNLYDLSFTGNTIIGGFRGLQVTAYPSESPRDWGWTRNVVFDATITENVFQDVLWLNQLGVSHSVAARANYGHLYLTASFQNNLFRWSENFLTQQIRQEPGDADLFLPGLEVGEGGIWDDHESRLTVANNKIDLPIGWANRPAIWFRSGTVNNQPAQGEIVTLTSVQKLSAPTGLALVHDSGKSSSDSLTNDARLRMDTLAGLSYQYRVGSSGSWLAIPNPAGWLPTGLMDGVSTVFVRGVDKSGQSSPEASLSFTLDTTAPIAPANFSQSAFDTVAWSVSTSSDVVSQVVTFRNAAYSQTYDLSSSTSQIAPDQWIIGANMVDVFVEDSAGNRSQTVTGTFQYSSSGTWGGQDGSDYASLKRTLTPDGKQDIRLDIQGLPYGKTVTGLTVSAFGGGQWAWPTAPAGSYAAYWRASANNRAGSIYFQTNRTENGRPFNVAIQFSDGTSVNFWVVGGKANPNLRVVQPQLLKQNQVASTVTGKSATAAKAVARVRIPVNRPKTPVRAAVAPAQRVTTVKPLPKRLVR